MIRDLIDMLKYAFGNAVHNIANATRAGKHNDRYGALGSAIVGALIGSVAFPIGTILGFTIGGLVGMTVSYGLSDK